MTLAEKKRRWQAQLDRCTRPTKTLAAQAQEKKSYLAQLERQMEEVSQ